MIKVYLFTIVIYLRLQLSNQLTCTIYDYTGSTVTCTSSCPSGSVLVDSNKCLRKDQYLITGNVKTCQSAHTSLDRLLCCQKDQFIYQNSCNVCNGQTFSNGAFCCSNSEYMNYASSSVQCTKISLGECSSLNFQTKIKVCCPSNQFYHLQLQICVSSSFYNCDTNLRACCNTGQYIEYLKQSNSYQCIQKCDWKDFSSLKCSQKYCSQNLIAMQSYKSLRDLYNTTQFDKSSISLLSANGQCCYGFSTTNQCLKSAVQCPKRFINRGWTICCPFGFFYSIKQKICTENCSGYILLNILCISNSNYLMLNGASGTAPLQSASALCEGLNLPSFFPICCPNNFYFDGTQGCRYCIGTIHKLSLNQLCCLKGQYFDKIQQKCKICSGIVDQSGTICCFQNQFFQYTTAGLGSCNGICDIDNIYKTDYCCPSISVTSCQQTQFKPNACSSQYFIKSSCQLCPKFCSNLDTCSTNNLLQCTKKCFGNSVYSSDVNDCLDCDDSCKGCTLPFDSNFCVSCQDGYVMVNKNCVKCNIQCKTCSGSVSFCTSCYQDGPKPYYQNGQCSIFCESGSYASSNSLCLNCNLNCIQCQGSSSSQCSKCNSGFYISNPLAGQCLTCSSGCTQCFRNSSGCIGCKSDLKYYLNTRACTDSCAVNQVSNKFSNFDICLPCHSRCKSCLSNPQNCNFCKNNSEYLDGTLGVNICQDCVEPCVTCISQTNCTTCIDGYYLNSTSMKCNQCYSKCQTCHQGSQFGCLSCFGDSQLVGGKCIGCSSSCTKCDINQNCLECSNSLFLFQGSCINVCPDGYYGLNKKCSICYSQCKTCTNGSQDGCKSCINQLQLINGKCVGCSQNCLTCNSNLSCTQCKSSYFLFQENCLIQCPKGTYKSINLCRICPSSCSSCTNPSNCVQCTSGFPILFKGECLVDCPSGFQRQSSNSNSCIPSNNNTNNNTNNNNTNNNTNNNSTNNNTGNNTFPNNSRIIILQTFVYDNRNQFGYLNLYFSADSNNSTIVSYIQKYSFYLLNIKTSMIMKIQTVITEIDIVNKKCNFKVGPFNINQVNNFDAILSIVLNNSSSINSVKSTQASNILIQASNNIHNQQPKLVNLQQVKADTYLYKKISAQYYSQLITSQYHNSPLSNIKIIGVIISIAFLLFSIFSKLKSHFLAQQANSLLLHFINFSQIVYIFKFIKLDQNEYFSFIQGFGYSLLSFFPNFFQRAIPQDYIQITNKISLVPDANLIRNTGFIFSYQIIILATMILLSGLSYAWFKYMDYKQMPQIRKIMRIMIFFFHLGFLPQLFFSFAQIIVPSKTQVQYSSFYNTNIAFAYVNIFLIPILMAVIFYHYYKTYNSDVLQHYYTLRQGGQYFQIYIQSLILCFSIDRPLIALTLIPLQICWLIYNYQLYRYGQGFSVTDCLKFFISSCFICLGYLSLSLIQHISWPIIVAVLCLIFTVLLFYSSYQVIGLYYYYLFRGKGQKSF